ncbi:MAG: ornithine cyclodeaminase family protein, partial [Sphingomonas sp.]
MNDAIDAVERVFVQLHRGEAEICPVVLGRGTDRANLFSVKGGAIDSSALVGVKIGTYWPGNRQRGQRAHASTTLLLDPATGLPHALIAASHLTALRTAASDGVAIRHLSRPESSSLALIGAGHQAWFELMAACAVRPIRRLRVWSRRLADAEYLAERAQRETGIPDCARADLPDAISSADIVVTVTAAREALVQREWVKPGTHISAMGSDA